MTAGSIASRKRPIGLDALIWTCLPIWIAEGYCTLQTAGRTVLTVVDAQFCEIGRNQYRLIAQSAFALRPSIR